MGKLKIFRRRKGQLVVSYQVVTDPCCGLSVIFWGFTLCLIGCKTIHIPEISSGVHGLMGKTVNLRTGIAVCPVQRICLDMKVEEAVELFFRICFWTGLCLVCPIL